MARKDTPRQQSRPMIEWVFGAVSALIVGALLLYLGYSALDGASRPPDLAASVEEMTEVGNGVLIVVAVRNAGDQAASAVGVEADIRQADGSVETKQIQFDYIAGHGLRRGAFVADGRAIRPTDVELRVHGYMQP